MRLSSTKGCAFKSGVIRHPLNLIPTRTERPGSRASSRRHGLLDSYRQEKGAEGSSNAERGLKPQKFTRHPRDTTSEKRCRGDEDDDVLCTPECVREILSAEEFDEALETASPSTLIVVDFYKTACGSCRYIQPGFVKLCHSSEEEHAPVMFLKHNVIDEADQETDLSEKLKIRNVPLFQFYKDNSLLEQFATREKKRIGNAINLHVGREVCHI